MTVKLSATEQYLRNVIAKHRSQIASMSIVQFSEFANVSTATIVRTMKKLGYSGYTDFRHSLLSEAKEDQKYAVLRDADDKIKQVITMNQQEVNQTIANLDISAIEDGIQQLHSADVVYVFARGLSETIGEEMALKLQLLGKYVQFYSDPNIIRIIAGRTKPGAVAIIVTLNGKTPELVEAAQTLNARNVPVMTITTNEDSPIVQYTDILFNGYKSSVSYFPDYEVRSRLPIQVIGRILLDSYVVREGNPG